MWCRDNPDYKFSFYTLKSGHISLPWTSDLHRQGNRVMKLLEPLYCENWDQPIFLLTEDDLYSAACNREGVLLVPPPFSNHDSVHYCLEVEQDEFVCSWLDQMLYLLHPLDSKLTQLSNPSHGLDSEWM